MGLIDSQLSATGKERRTHNSEYSEKQQERREKTKVKLQKGL